MKYHKIILYGRHACETALQNEGRKKLELLILRDRLKTYHDLIEKYKNTCKFTVIDTQCMNKLLPTKPVHQGIALIVKAMQGKKLQQALEDLRDTKHISVILLDHLHDSRNIGAIIRSAVAFDIDMIIIPTDQTPAENSNMVKTASGAIESAPLVYVKNLSQTLQLLKEHGFWCYGLDGNGNSSLNKIKFHERSAIVLGSEHSGIRPLVKKQCDFIVSIPNSNKVESLNASNAISIAMYSYFINYRIT